MATRRRWFQFSLRSLFVLTTAVCIWLGWRTIEARRMQEAIRAIESAGGSIEYNDNGAPIIVRLQQPARLGDNGELLLPLGYEGGMIGISDRDPVTITDDGMKYVARLRDLEELYIGSVLITDAGLKHLHGMKHLQRVEVWYTLASKAGITALRDELPQCKIVYRRLNTSTSFGSVDEMH